MRKTGSRLGLIEKAMATATNFLELRLQYWKNHSFNSPNQFRFLALTEAVFRLGKTNFHTEKNGEMTKFQRQPKYKLTLSESSRIHAVNAQHEGT